MNELVGNISSSKVESNSKVRELAGKSLEPLRIPTLNVQCNNLSISHQIFLLTTLLLISKGENVLSQSAHLFASLFANQNA